MKGWLKNWSVLFFVHSVSAYDKKIDVLSAVEQFFSKRT